jgi:hypothetical protein
LRRHEVKVVEGDGAGGELDVEQAALAVHGGHGAGGTLEDVQRPQLDFPANDDVVLRLEAGAALRAGKIVPGGKRFDHPRHEFRPSLPGINHKREVS